MSILYWRAGRDGRRIQIAGALALITFCLLAAVISNDKLMIGLHVSRILIALGVIFTYRQHWMQALRADRVGRVNQLALGIAATWFAAALASVYWLVWRLGGQPLWFINHDFNAFVMVISILGGVLHLTAMRDLETNAVPAKNWLWLFMGFVLGCVSMYFYTVELQVRFAMWLDMLRIWMAPTGQ